MMVHAQPPTKERANGIASPEDGGEIDVPHSGSEDGVGRDVRDGGKSAVDC